MSLPYYPMYPTDFEADTSHLTLAEDGAYNRLLRLMWMTPGCSLPDDDQWILRRMRCQSADEREIVMTIIDEFFQRKAGRIVNPRLAKEYQKTDLAHRKRVSAGSKGGKAKALKTNEKALSKAKAMLKQPEPEPEPYIKEEEPKGSSKKKRATRLPEDWALPKDWGGWAISQGWPEQTVRIEAEKFRDYWIARSGKDAAKLDWLATWRNWMRNSRAPRIIQGRKGKTSAKQSITERMFSSDESMDSREDRNTTQPLLPTRHTGDG